MIYKAPKSQKESGR